MASLNPVTGFLEIESSGGRSVGNAGATLDLSMFANVVLPGSATVAGTTTITSSSASALAVGRQGATKPVLKINAATALQVTGIEITGAGTGAGVAIAVIETGGTNNNLTIDAMGSGTISLGATSTGAIVLARATGVTGALTVTSASASSFAVGRLGATTPAFQVDSSTAVQVVGIKVTGGAAAGGAAIAVNVAANPMFLDAGTTGRIDIGATSTGLVVMGRGARSGVVQNWTKVAIGTQNAAPTIAQLLNGYISHTSVTGAGTFTTPTGAAISAGIAGVATGDMFRVLYANIGNQTVTITAGDGNVTFPVGQVVAIPTHRYAELTFYCVSAGVWEVSINLIAAA